MGFTPAYAGNTCLRASLRVRRQVHPRIRGEYSTSFFRLSYASGSPPHTRGIPLIEQDEFLAFGFTPAYAGNTCPPSRQSGGRRVHPRIRGEYDYVYCDTDSIKGSPPHTRGIRQTNVKGRITAGFTPAYAGNTMVKPFRQFAAEVHPRIRGEYSPVRIVPGVPRGSPPHTRGILPLKKRVNFAQRFTPAYAGNTAAGADVCRAYQVHPRIRGEYNMASLPEGTHEGSPPHTRGIPIQQENWLVIWRFTPAYAGNTPVPDTRKSSAKVHPRIRGEYENGGE